LFVPESVATYEYVKLQVIVRLIVSFGFQHAAMPASITAAEDQGLEDVRCDYGADLFEDAAAGSGQMAFQRVAAIYSEAGWL
jgi:hypothetical protein